MRAECSVMFVIKDAVASAQLLGRQLRKMGIGAIARSNGTAIASTLETGAKRAPEP
jgi:hypothetical protein